MDGRRKMTNVAELISWRQTSYSLNQLTRHKLQVTDSMIYRLGLESELTGHFGCVNCLEWNHDGSLLASASDDVSVILWDPYRHKSLLNYNTGHTMNIFSVKFLPQTNDKIVATGSADTSVLVHDLSRGGAIIKPCYCHSGRVKRLVVAPDCPYLLWSAAEDAIVMQHDLRAPHACFIPGDPPRCEASNVVVKLKNHLGQYAEAKCLALNARRPEQLAVGANDFFVRVYDRRMIKLQQADNYLWEASHNSNFGNGDAEDNVPVNCVRYYAPGHLWMSDKETNLLVKKAATYVSFSPDGNELLVNLAGEQLYLYDLLHDIKPTVYTGDSFDHLLNKETRGEFTQREKVKLPPCVESVKCEGNLYLRRYDYVGALNKYNQAINMNPNYALLYINRAIALVKRHWAGDVYSAVRDCYKAIGIDPFDVKCHFNLARGLLDLYRAKDAKICLNNLKELFPRYANIQSVQMLERDIDGAIIETEKARIPLPDGARDGFNGFDPTSISAFEKTWRANVRDFKERFLGHCNTTTDIKEANFLGNDGRYIMAGSDDGSIFIWERSTSNILRIIRADSSIVNCVQPHPQICLIASSGIDHLVRLWSPRDEDGTEDEHVVLDHSSAATANQHRMTYDPFEAVLLGNGDTEANGGGVSCRTS